MTGQSDVTPVNTTTRTVEVLRTGTFKAMGGQQVSFSDTDLSAIIEQYDPEQNPAPAVIGHPQHDDPAFGWVENFDLSADGTLRATLKDLEPTFVEAVSKGRYRKISLSMFHPDAPNNPTPGTYYPRHVGFLGGAAPAVSGLQPVQFADGDTDEIIEISFSDPAFEPTASVFRKLREFLIEKFGKDAANEAVPEYLIQWIDEAKSDPEPLETASFADPTLATPPQIITQKEVSMSGTDDAAALKLREDNISKRERELNARDHISFADELIEGGKLLPASKGKVVALMGALDAADASDDANVISFADGSETKTSSSMDLLKGILSDQPKIVPTGETNLGDDPDTTPLSFAAPDGVSVDRDDVALHQKALAFQTQNPGTEYIDAVNAVTGG